MTECDEVAEAMRPEWNIRYPYARRRQWEPKTRANMARQFVTQRMPDETPQVIDNVAEALQRE